MEQAERQYLWVGADFWLLPVPNPNACRCNSKFTMLQSNITMLIQVSGRQMLTPRTVGVTNAPTNQEWCITIWPEDVFQIALKDRLQKKTPTNQIHKKHFRLEKNGWLNMKWNHQATKGILSFLNSFISPHIYSFGSLFRFFASENTAEFRTVDCTPVLPSKTA